MPDNPNYLTKKSALLKEVYKKVRIKQPTRKGLRLIKKAIRKANIGNA